MKRITMRLILNAIAILTLSVSALRAQEIPVTMKAKLAKDSLERSDDYFLRINKVRTVTEEGEDEKVVIEVNQYGQTTTYTRWYLDKLDYKQEFTYDHFGNIVLSEMRFYDDAGSVRTYFTTTMTYEIDPGGMTEHIVKEEGKDIYYEDGRKSDDGSSVTTYEYDSQGRMVKEMEVGVVAYCMEGPQKFRKTTRTTYAKDGKISKTEEYTQGGCSSHEKEEIVVYSYDSLGRETSYTTTVDGNSDGRVVTTYSSNGQEESWTYYDGEGEEYMIYTFRYDERGLKVSSKSNYKGDKDHAEYTYTYY